MRLTTPQQEAIKSASIAIFGDDAQVFIFGSRANDQARGGDLDVLIKVPGSIDQPALKTARLSARISRLMNGRKVDVILRAEGLDHLPIHEIAERTGVPL